MAQNSTERRKHKRLNARGSLIIYNEKMYAEVIDISKGGLACSCRVSLKKMFSPVFNLEILDRKSGRFIKGLSGIMVRCTENKVEKITKKNAVLDFGIEFFQMTEEKENLLATFLDASLATH